MATLTLALVGAEVDGVMTMFFKGVNTSAG